MKVSSDFPYDLYADYRMSPKQKAGATGTLTVFSKLGGWMTVTPRRQSRREPIEKEHLSKNGVLKIMDQ